MTSICEVFHVLPLEICDYGDAVIVTVWSRKQRRRRGREFRPPFRWKELFRGRRKGDSNLEHCWQLKSNSYKSACPSDVSMFLGLGWTPPPTKGGQPGWESHHQKLGIVLRRIEVLNPVFQRCMYCISVYSTWARVSRLSARRPSGSYFMIVCCVCRPIFYIAH